MFILELLGAVILAVVAVVVGITLIVSFIVGLWALLCWIMLKLGWITEEEIVKINSPHV